MVVFLHACLIFDATDVGLDQLYFVTFCLFFTTTTTFLVVQCSMVCRSLCLDYLRAYNFPVNEISCRTLVVRPHNKIQLHTCCKS